MLREVLVRILTDYPRARSEPYEGHALASFIRDDTAEAVRAILRPHYPELIVKGSAGAGNWADVPWIAVFDPKVTESATRGYYVVYLFSADGADVHLSLNQGATAVRDEFKAKAPEVLGQRAALMRRRLSDFGADLPATAIMLRSLNQLPRDYEAGHALGRTYNVEAMPDDAALAADLLLAAKAYLSLEFRGGLDPSLEGAAESEEDVPKVASLIERRRYRMHRRIERNSRAASEAKRVHGTTCQACRMNFEAMYGEIGAGFIEAHHLKALSTLEEGTSAAYDPKWDFAVLCPNCHRMIHRTDNPADLSAFVSMIRRRL